jgi:hypothetical protein
MDKELKQEAEKKTPGRGDEKSEVFDLISHEMKKGGSSE